MNLTFKTTEKSRRGVVRVQMKVIVGVLKVRKWNYRSKRWGRWSAYEG